MVLEQIPRPDVDYIQGLSPVIALEQRNGGGGNPRSTVATVTEIADFARVLWAVCGTPYCPKDGGIIERRSMDDCLTRIYSEPEGSRLIILAPWMTAKPAILREELLDSNNVASSGSASTVRFAASMSRASSILKPPRSA